PQLVDQEPVTRRMLTSCPTRPPRDVAFRGERPAARATRHDELDSGGERERFVGLVVPIRPRAEDMTAGADVDADDHRNAARSERPFPHVLHGVGGAVHAVTDPALTHPRLVFVHAVIMSRTCDSNGRPRSTASPH